MKKFYSTLLAVAMGALMSVSAKTVEVAPGIVVDFDNPIPASNAVKAQAKAQANLGSRQLMKHSDVKIESNGRLQKSRAAEDWVPVGQGRIQDLVFTGTWVDVEIEEDANTPGVYRLTSPWSYAAEIINANPDADLPYSTEGALPLIIDASDPECVVIDLQSTGIYNIEWGSEVYVASESWLTMVQDGCSKEECKQKLGESNITFAENIITIPAQSLLNFYPDSEVEDEYNGGLVAENIYVANSSTMLILFPGAEYVEPWVYWGEGEFKDGMISPFFGYEGEDNPPYAVDVLAGNGDNYGIISFNAWSVWGKTGDAAYMDWDVSNPECVIIPLQYFSNTQNYGPMYYMSASFNFVGPEEEGGMTVEEFIESKYGERNIAIDGDIATTPLNCIYAYFPEYDEEHLYTLPSEEGYLVLPADISELPDGSQGEDPGDDPGEDGIIDIEAASDAAPVYYNLQGVQISSPAAGQLYIVKTGSKVAKQIIR